MTIKQVPSVQLTNSFCLESIYSSDSPSTSSTSSPSSYIFHCRSRSGLEWWMKNITEQLTKLSQRNEELLQQKEQRRNSMIKVARRASANWKLNTLPDNLSTESLEQTTSTPPPPPPPSSMSPSPSTTRPSEKLDHIRLSIKDASIRLESLNNPNISQPRVQYILKYLSNEFQFQRNLVDFYQVVIEPLVNTSKGAELIIGLTEIEKIDSFTTRNDLNPILFEKKGSYLGVLDSFTGKKQTQQIIEIISDSNFQIFLYTIENITYTLMEFLLLFEMSLINVNYIDHLIILGTPCTSSQANILYQLFLSYSSSYHTALRILSSSYLGKFIQQTNEKLQSYFTHTSTHTTSTSGTSNTTTIHTFLINILHFPERLKVFLIKLHEMTSINHPDHQLLDHAIQQLRHLIQQMHDVYIGHINYEKLILIQNSFLLNLLQPEPYLKQLVSYQRIFIREGNLIKVCRKANCEYRFWLFNDALLYGKFSHTTRKYKLHRVIELKSICNIQPYNMRNGLERQYSFIINSLEKSFILIATTQDERNSWLYDITTWWNKLNHHHNNTSTTSSGISNTSSNNGANTSTSTGAATTTTPSTSVDGDNEPAPLWVPDSLTSVCYICNIVSSSTHIYPYLFLILSCFLSLVWYVDY